MKTVEFGKIGDRKDNLQKAILGRTLEHNMQLMNNRELMNNLFRVRISPRGNNPIDERTVFRYCWIGQATFPRARSCSYFVLDSCARSAGSAPYFAAIECSDLRHQGRSDKHV